MINEWMVTGTDAGGHWRRFILYEPAGIAAAAARAESLQANAWGEGSHITSIVNVEAEKS